MSTSSHASTSRSAASDLERTVVDLERQLDELRSQLAKERQSRRLATERSRQKRRAATASLDELVASWTGQAHAAADDVEMRLRLQSKLETIDDEILTALLTLSTASLAKLVAGGETTAAVLAIPTLLVPSKSVGIEGVGSGAEIDRRLAYDLNEGTAATNTPPLGIEAAAGREREHQDRPGSDPVSTARQRATQAMWMKQWLQQRRYRNDRLLTHLSRFTQLHITSVTSKTAAASRAVADVIIRTVQLQAQLSDLCPLSLRYDIHEPAPSTPQTSKSTPQMHNLSVVLPPSLSAALAPNRHLARTLRHANLPALMLSLRTLLTLASVRKRMFAELRKRYPHLVGDAQRHAPPWSPPQVAASRDAAPPRVKDESVLASLVDPRQAERLVFVNHRKATLTLTFTIAFTRHGHAHPSFSLVPSLPPSLVDAAPVQALLDSFKQRFDHLVRYLTSHRRNLISQHQDDDDDTQRLKTGVLTAVIAIVDAFFGTLQPQNDRDGR
ncbi:hypothetical protein ACQY0O_000276 [Thecaphora frezii]